MRKRKLYMIEFDCGDELSVELLADGGVSIGGENGDTSFWVDNDSSRELSPGEVTELFAVFSSILRDRKAMR